MMVIGLIMLGYICYALTAINHNIYQVAKSIDELKEGK